MGDFFSKSLKTETLQFSNTSKKGVFDAHLTQILMTFYNNNIYKHF